MSKLGLLMAKKYTNILFICLAGEDFCKKKFGAYPVPFSSKDYLLSKV